MARYYLCPHHDPVRAGGTDRRCTERRVRADELDAFVFDQVRQLLARPELLAAGEAALSTQGPAPDAELVAAQLARLDRRLEGADAERRRVADLYQAGVIDRDEMARRAGELDSRRRRLGEERQALAAHHVELGEHTRLARRIGDFAQRALAGIEALDSMAASSSCASSSKTCEWKAGRSSSGYAFPSTRVPIRLRAGKTERWCRCKAGEPARPDAPDRRGRGCQAMTVCVPLVNACLTCPDFQTTVQFLPVHRRQADATRELVEAAASAGHERLATNHRRVLANLEKIIPALEAVERDEASVG